MRELRPPSESNPCTLKLSVEWSDLPGTGCHVAEVIEHCAQGDGLQPLFPPDRRKHHNKVQITRVVT
jgi:hypothetical protein